MAATSLADAIEEIKAVLLARLVAQKIPDGALEEVATLLMGDRYRAGPTLPLVMIVPDSAINENNTAGLTETWVMPFGIVSVVEETSDPVVGLALAGTLAAEARAVAMGRGLTGHPRGLGLSYVSDIVSLTFDPANELLIRGANGSRDATIYSAAAVVAVRFQVRGG